LRGRRRLESAQPHLGAIIGTQALGDETRQKDFGLSQLFDDTRLHMASGFGRTQKLSPQHDADIATDHSSNRHKETR
jgi:hypothetical protein